jgi:transposase
VAARPGRTRRARAGALPHAPGQAPHDAEEPHSPDADRARLAALECRSATQQGRAQLASLDLPQPWRGTLRASLALIETLDEQIDTLELELRRLGADHHYAPLLYTIPGIAWILAYTIASEIGDISRFASPRKLIGYTGL